MKCRFVADVHLGKLARILRLLGFDTVYQNDFSLSELLNISLTQERWLLSRNSSLSKMPSVPSFIVSSEVPLQQVRQLVDLLHLRDQFLPFSRCIACNGILEKVYKESIASRLEKNTCRYFNEFWQCQDCHRVYWKGSHYERMLKTIGQITS